MDLTFSPIIGEKESRPFGPARAISGPFTTAPFLPLCYVRSLSNKIPLTKAIWTGWRAPFLTFSPIIGEKESREKAIWTGAHHIGKRPFVLWGHPSNSDWVIRTLTFFVAKFGEHPPPPLSFPFSQYLGGKYRARPTSLNMGAHQILRNISAPSLSFSQNLGKRPFGHLARWKWQSPGQVEKSWEKAIRTLGRVEMAGTWPSGRGHSDTWPGGNGSHSAKWPGREMG